MAEVTKPLANYSHVRGHGDFFYIAGQGARDPSTNQVVGVETDSTGKVTSYDIQKQTRQVFANLDAVLSSISRTKDDLIDVTVFLCDMADFEAMNREWNKYFTGRVPARTTIAVKALPLHNFVEMKAVATR